MTLLQLREGSRTFPETSVLGVEYTSAFHDNGDVDETASCFSFLYVVR